MEHAIGEHPYRLLQRIIKQASAATIAVENKRHPVEIMQSVPCNRYRVDPMLFHPENVGPHCLHNPKYGKQHMTQPRSPVHCKLQIAKS